MKRLFQFSIVLLILAIKPGSLWSRVFMSQDQALALAFSPGMSVERKTVYLTEEQRKQIEQKAKSKMDTRLVTYYQGVDDSQNLSFAFFNSHTVRTMPETLMAVFDSEGHLKMVEILAFYEPEDYLPPRRWLGLFQKKKLDDDLWVKRSIRNVTGATLSTQAITDSVRRILATFEIVIQPLIKEPK